MKGTFSSSLGSAIRNALVSVLSPTLLACTAAYGQTTPISDSCTHTASPATDHGSRTELDVYRQTAGWVCDQCRF
jgi:hypothetical protein